MKVYPALEGTYRGRKVYTPRAPTSGPVLLHMLNLLERYDLEGEGRTGLNVHRLVEVIKCAFTFLFSWMILRLIGFSCFSRLRCKVLVESSSFVWHAYWHDRTKVCDPAYTNDTSRIDEISTKTFGKLIYPNITDVRTLHLLFI